MSKAAVAVKAPESPAPIAAPAAAPAAAPPAALAPKPAPQKLRDVQPKKFPPSALKPLGYGDTQIMTAVAPPGMTFTEAMQPIAWSTVAAFVARDVLSTRNLKDGVGSLIVLDSEDGTFHALLRIGRVQRDGMNNPCGLDLICIGPSVDLTTGKAAPIDLATGKAWVDPVKPNKDD